MNDEVRQQCLSETIDRQQRFWRASRGACLGLLAVSTALGVACAVPPPSYSLDTTGGSLDEGTGRVEGDAGEGGNSSVYRLPNRFTGALDEVKVVDNIAHLGAPMTLPEIRLDFAGATQFEWSSVLDAGYELVIEPPEGQTVELMFSLIYADGDTDAYSCEKQDYEASIELIGGSRPELTPKKQTAMSCRTSSPGAPGATLQFEGKFEISEPTSLRGFRFVAFGPFVSSGETNYQALEGRVVSFFTRPEGGANSELRPWMAIRAAP